MSITSIIFVVIFLGGIFGSVLIDGVYGICLYQLIYFINPGSQWWYGNLPDLRYSFIIALCILIGFLIRKNKYSNNRIFDVPQSKWLFALTILMGLVSFIAVWPEKHNAIYTNHIKIIFYVFLLYKIVDTPQKFEKLMWAYMIGGFYTGWIAHSRGRSGDGRLEGLGPTDSAESNALGALLVTFVPILIFYIIKSKTKWQRFLSIIFLAYIMDGIVLANSRGSFLGLVASLFYMSYFVFFKKIGDRNFKIKIGIGFIVGILMFIYLADDSFWDRMGTLKKVEVSEDGTLAGAQGGAHRTKFWLKGLELVEEYPFGVGGWGYLYLSPQFLDSEDLVAHVGGMRAPHSTWIDALVDCGYLGLILFLGFLISSFNLSRKVRRHFLEEDNYYLYFQNIAIDAGFIAFLVASTFIDRLYAETMYVFPAIMAASANIYLLKGHSFGQGQKTTTKDV